MTSVFFGRARELDALKIVDQTIIVEKRNDLGLSTCPCSWSRPIDPCISRGLENANSMKSEVWYARVREREKRRRLGRV